MKQWHQITTWNAAFGVCVNEYGIIVDAAPIAKHAIGQKFETWKKRLAFRIKCCKALKEEE